jgi:hypothetical protein
MNGSEVHSYEINSTDPRGNVLPLSSRWFIDDLKGIGTPGRYTIVANVTHGAGGEIITTKVNFWYIPLWMIGVVVVLVLAIAGAVYWRLRQGGKTRKVRKF